MNGPRLPTLSNRLRKANQVRFIYFVIASMATQCGAIRDAVVSEVQTATSRISEDIAAGELGSRALETRKQQAHDLREKGLTLRRLAQCWLGRVASGH